MQAFSRKPSKNKRAPDETSSGRRRLATSSCGSSAAGRVTGPATMCGKNAMAVANLGSDVQAGSRASYTSIT